MSDVNLPVQGDSALSPTGGATGFHPLYHLLFRVYRFLASPQLAMFLLVAILASCLAGVTVWRNERAWQLIFSTLWFNGLLVLLVVNVACCFFGRIRRRALTLVSFGMILFHLSFVAMFLGIVYNSLFFFEGTVRLTEGETVSNCAAQSWESFRYGRFFSPDSMMGETTLIRMHRGYRVGKDDKRAAYEIEVGKGGARKRDIIYATHNLDCDGYKYLTDKEGYTALVVLCDRGGDELYGAFLPLQSLKREDGGYFYSTGTKDMEGNLPFPQPPERPVFHLQAGFRPFPTDDRRGEAFFKLWPYSESAGHPTADPTTVGSAYVGKLMPAGEYQVAVKEIRYWVGMKVRHDPGKPVVLGSLWVGLAGMVITTLGRMRRGRRGTPAP